MSLVVQLPKFEGPLALLLYLIRKEEMDIFDIKIHEITNQYLEYIKIMKELDLELAGEFVAMAATLIQIKSRMLLPQYDEKGEVIEVEDPRKELVQKLLEYQKYQEAAKLLYERPLVGRDMWTRGFRESLDEPPEEIEVEDNGLFSLISMYRLIMRSAKKRVHQVTAKAQSIASRILELKEKLIFGQRATLNSLIDVVEDKSRQVLITFLSLLELGKLGFVSLYQSENYSDIWVDLKKPIEKDVVSRVEEYDTINSQEVASQLFGDKTEDVDHTQDNAEDFVLKDAEDVVEQMNPDEPLFSAEDMASDEEILLAEQELAGEVSLVSSPATDELLAAVEGISVETPMIEETHIQTEIHIDQVQEKTDSCAADQINMVTTIDSQVSAELSSELSGIELVDELTILEVTAEEMAAMEQIPENTKMETLEEEVSAFKAENEASQEVVETKETELIESRDKEGQEEFHG